jgi:restriction endonuclease S subunit
MKKIDTTDWKEYKMSDLFDIRGRGTITVEELTMQYGDGVYPYVTRTEKNNGITGFFDYRTVEQNTMTIETTLSGICFYHEYEFSTGDHIAVLKPRSFELNKYVALFIKAIWQKNSYKYDYGRPAIVENIKNTCIILPTKNNEPDWQYMENYMRELEKQVKFKPIKTKKPKKLQVDTTDWKEFDTHKLFDVMGTATTSLHELETTYGYGDSPYITTRATNNSVAGFYDFSTEKGNVLVVDSAVTGFVSYQDTDFTASDHVELLKPKPSIPMNKYIGLFIRTIFMKGSYKYAYGRKFNQSRIKTTKLLLPVNKKGEPDFEYMENYIKSLPYAEYI